MISFNNIQNSGPLKILYENYKKALNSKEKNIERLVISSFNRNKNEVDSRCVNLKFVNGNEFIFFSNYQSEKANDFKSHNQVSALLYWESINLQVRIKAKITKTSTEFNAEYFNNRSPEKNALAISSDQSQIIASYDLVKEKYEFVKKNKNLLKCPKYWGGYSFSPYLIEFWEGNDFRLNKRNMYRKEKNIWNHSILEP